MDLIQGGQIVSKLKTAKWIWMEKISLLVLQEFCQDCYSVDFSVLKYTSDQNDDMYTYGYYMYIAVI